MLAITLLAFGNSAHATCDADGFITGANGPIVLGTAGCATNPGVVSGTVDSSAAVAAPGSTGVTSVASPGWAVTNHGIITAGGNGVTGDALFTLTNSGMITAGYSGALIGGGSTVINSIGGTITGDFTGLSISANGGSTTGGPSTVDNAGTITSAGGFNDAIILGLGGTVTNRSTGTISATGVGVAGDTNPTIVNNFGQILDASTGVGLSAGGTVTNDIGAINRQFVEGRRHFRRCRRRRQFGKHARERRTRDSTTGRWLCNQHQHWNDHLWRHARHLHLRRSRRHHQRGLR